MQRKSPKAAAAPHKLTLVPKASLRDVHLDFTPKSEAQKQLLKALDRYDIVVANGVAGTGKSYAAVAYALMQLLKKQVDRIVITRSAAMCDEEYGFLPGSLSDKNIPLYAAMNNIFQDLIGVSLFENLMSQGKIEIAPLGYLRGTTFKDTVVIATEAQNLTRKQAKMLLTRIGPGTKMIIEGDSDQCDIRESDSGLIDLIARIEGEPDFGLVQFDAKDCLRSYMARRVVEIYKKPLFIGLPAFSLNGHH